MERSQITRLSATLVLSLLSKPRYLTSDELMVADGYTVHKMAYALAENSLACKASRLLFFDDPFRYRSLVFFVGTAPR